MCAQISFEILTLEERKAILDQSIDFLEEQGADVYNEKAVEILAKAGCPVEGRRVRFPRKIVESAMETAPSVIDIYDREGEKAMEVGSDNVYFAPGPTCPSYFDPYTGERRPARKEDAVTTAILSDALPNIDYVMSLTMIGDRTKQLADIHEIDAMVRNTSKPLMGWAFYDRNCQVMIDMCAAVAGGLENLQRKPFLMVFCQPQSPFIHDKEALGVLMNLAENGIPCVYAAGVLAGATTPVTLAAALSIGIADCLPGLVLSQVIRPGTPFIGGSLGSIMDMRTTSQCYGAPELVLTCSGSVEICRTIGIPSYTEVGCTDAKTIDAQAGAEAMMQIIGALGTHGSLVHDVGFMDTGLTGSPDYLVLCDELLAMGKRLMRGITVDEEHLAKDLIEEVGPGGEFVTEDHTLEFFHENWEPEMMERRPYQYWEAEGSKTMADRAHARMLEILKTHEPKPLPDEVVARLDALVEAAEKAEVQRG